VLWLHIMTCELDTLNQVCNFSCLWLPDDGFLVNRNMLEQLFILKCFNNSTFFNFVCIRCWILLMHGCNYEV